MTKKTDWGILAAPMQGYTGNAFRCAHAKIIGGVNEYFIPFVRLEGTLPRPRDLRELNPRRNPSNAVAQILPGSAEETETLCQIIEVQGFSRIDLNFGCPFIQVTRHGRGCGLLADSKRGTEILERLNRFPHIHFSLKLRSGLHSRDEWKNLLSAINAAPLDIVTFHPRTGDEGYAGTPDPDVFAEFREHCRHRVYWNGDLRTVDDIQTLRQRFPELSGIMLGRGLLSDVLLPKKLRNSSFQEESEIRAFYREFLALLLKEEQPLSKLKAFWEYFLPNTPKRARKQLLKTRTWDDAVSASEAALDAAFSPAL